MSPAETVIIGAAGLALGVGLGKLAIALLSRLLRSKGSR